MRQRTSFKCLATTLSNSLSLVKEEITIVGRTLKMLVRSMIIMKEISIPWRQHCIRATTSRHTIMTRVMVVDVKQMLTTLIRI